MSIFWKGTTTRGALIGGFLGLLSATLFGRCQSPGLGNDPRKSERTALFPYDNPALFSMSIAFIGIWLFSTTDRSSNADAERASFGAQYIRSETGMGAAGAASH